jgi:hypothetical protein
MRLPPHLALGLLGAGAITLLLVTSSSSPSVSVPQVDPNDLAKAAVLQAQAMMAQGDQTANGKLLLLAQAAQKAGYTQAAKTLMAGGGTEALIPRATATTLASVSSPTLRLVTAA